MEPVIESAYINRSTFADRVSIMSNLFGAPLLLGLVAFLIGWLAAKFSAYVGKRALALEAPAQHRTIRGLEATLRVAKKDAETSTEKLAASTQELETLRTSLNELEQTQQICEEEMECLRQAVKSESSKVVELRRNLTDHAEETIRARVSARDSKTELSVLKAGESVMSDELTDIFDDANDSEGYCNPAPGEESLDEPNTDGSAPGSTQAKTFMSDC